MNDIPEINKRFLKVLKHYDYSGYKFSKEFSNVSESKITHIRSGRNEPSKDLINTLLKKFNKVNTNWLLTGEGNMIIEDEIVSEPKIAYGSKNECNECMNRINELTTMVARIQHEISLLRMKIEK